MKVLYIGGTGDISLPCVRASVAAGHEVAVFNRGRSEEPLPAGVRQVVGDLADDASYSRLSRETWDVVCQFKAYTLRDAQRDVRTFAGACGQYVFISSASAYRKPPTTWRLTEDVPLSNPFWPYSQAKADMEAMFWRAHADGRMPVTVVRPSHTYRRRFPGTFIDGDNHAWRMLQVRPVVVHGDGQALWTLTHAADFAPTFVKLLGEPRAAGESYHIMTDTPYTWDQIYAAVGRALGVEPRLVHVPTETIVRYDPAWAGPLLGDKAWTTLFDTSKVRAIAGDIPATVPIDEGFAAVRHHFERRMQTFTPDEALHAKVDRMAAEQQRLGP